MTRSLRTARVAMGCWGGCLLLALGQVAETSVTSVVINEIHSDPVVKTRQTEFVELFNRSGAPVDLSGWGLGGGVEFQFPEGTGLPAGGYLVVAGRPESIQTHFGVEAIGPFDGRLANEGEVLQLEDPEGAEVDSVEWGLGFPWPTVGDPPGYSLELVHPDLDNARPGHWRSWESVAEATSNGDASPTPGRRNSVYATSLPPRIEAASHSPEQPRTGETVRITARVEDPGGVAAVELTYQPVEPGDYFSKEDARYESDWTRLTMRDDGTGADQAAGDGVYSVEIPASEQQHRHLIRYRIEAEDTAGQSLRVPYPDDPQPNFAYFVYDGVPAWEGAIDPDSDDPELAETVRFGPQAMRRLPIYHLLSDHEDVMDAQFHEQYRGSEYKWEGTLIYDGEVYDHVHYRARGGVWRYAMGKNMWKFDFNRGHHFQARDNYGREYDTVWDKLNFSAIIQQGNFGHRGEQGMFEAVGFKLFNRVGVEGPLTHWVQFRVIDDADEKGETQYDGDLWGMYLVVEQPDGRLLDEHGLPDGNFYKMEAGTGEKNNQGPTAPADKSDLNAFLNTYRNENPSDRWWRENLDLDRYYSYRAIVEGIHHYDIGNGKNYFYYHNPITDIWSVHPWDLDLTWADNMFGDGNEPFKSRVLTRSVFDREYQNRLREIRDLLFNNDQAWQLIQEHAAIIDPPDGSPSMVDVDRMMWDYNPILESSFVNPSKAGHGRFYEAGIVPTFRGMVLKMGAYVDRRASWIDRNLLDESPIPETPEVVYAGQGDSYSVDDLVFRCSPFEDDTGSFAAMKWRLAEVTPSDVPAFDPAEPRAYEIDADWESGKLAYYRPEVTIPAGAAEVGTTYRVRARMKDSDGWWSHWSEPVQFAAAQASNGGPRVDGIYLTELMYHPSDDASLEYIELRNGSAAPVDLSGMAFTDGVEFTFPEGATVAAGERFLVVGADPANNFEAFREVYGLDAGISIWGAYEGRLDNGGERLVLERSSSGMTLFDLTYNDDRGWPLSADGAGDSLVPQSDLNIDVAGGGLNYGGNWRASTFRHGSPGEADPEPIHELVINEFLAHTDFDDPNFPQHDSNDWIELYHRGEAPIALEDWYLSDSRADLKKWALPEAMTLEPGEWVTFDEVTGFHTSPDTGFGLNKEGEQIYLSYLPGTDDDRVADAVRFGGQDNAMSLGRFPDGGEYWYPMTPSPEAASQGRSDRWGGVIISELVYHPSITLEASGGDDQAAELIELTNLRSQPLELTHSEGPWRLRGGIELDFPEGTTLREGESMLVVGFDPSDQVLLDELREAYGISEEVKVVGPYQGRLANDGEGVRLERPQAPDVAGDPVSWIIVDEVLYSDRYPWPEEADGEGDALHRLARAGPAQTRGNNPASWEAATPAPGEFEVEGGDRDQDGIPDKWESDHGLDPDDPTDAAEDRDGDGQSNLEEYMAGTDPADPGSRLEIGLIRIHDDGAGRSVEIRFDGVAGRAYELQRRAAVTGDAGWETVTSVPALAESRVVELNDPSDGVGNTRFYRLRLDVEASTF